jgi:hypothetical protein
MEIYVPVKPGSMLAPVPGFDFIEAMRFLSSLEGHYVEAVLALDLFNKASALRDSPRDLLDAPDAARAQRATRELLGGRSYGQLTAEEQFHFKINVKLRTLQLGLAAGRLPNKLMGQAPLLHARSFLYSFDAFYKMLGVFELIAGAPAELKQIRASMEQAFPDLIQIRNSAHHMEQRVQGKAHAKDIKPQPLKDAAGNDTNVLMYVVDSLEGDVYVASSANGQIGRFPIQAAALGVLYETLQRVLLAFQWEGEPGPLFS